MASRSPIGYANYLTKEQLEDNIIYLDSENVKIRVSSVKNNLTCELDSNFKSR